MCAKCGIYLPERIHQKTLGNYFGKYSGDFGGNDLFLEHIFSSVFLGVRWAQKTLMDLEPRCLDFWAKLSVVELIG